VLTHFAEIRHPDLKMFWAAMLFNTGDVSQDVVNHLLDALQQPARAKLLADIVGPDFKFFRRKVLSHPFANQNGLVQPMIEDEEHGSWDHSVKLWDVATGKEIRSFPQMTPER
jgi:WD40 repeat protein